MIFLFEINEKKYRNSYSPSGIEVFLAGTNIKPDHYFACRSDVLEWIKKMNKKYSRKGIRFGLYD